MIGSIAWTMRDTNGNETRMVRGANSVPAQIKSRDFINQDPAYVHGCTQAWDMMRDDWHANNATGDFAYPMTQEYASKTDCLIPTEYGIVVTCAKSGVILSCQSVTDMNSITASGVLGGPEAAKNDPIGHKALLSFADDGMIRSYDLFVMQQNAVPHLESMFRGVVTKQPTDITGYTVVSVPGTVRYANLVRFGEVCRKEYGTGWILSAEANFKYSGFNLEEFPHNAAGLVAIKDRIRELAFSLSLAEDIGWDKAIEKAQRRTDAEQAEAASCEG